MIDNPKYFLYYVVGIMIVVALGIAIWRGAGTPSADSPNVTVENGTSTAQSSGSSRSSSGSKTSAPAAYDAVVTYYDSGFSPNSLVVKKGQTVRFLNRSNTTMRVVSVESGDGAKGISQPASAGYGESFDYNFVTAGTYLYQNLNSKTKTGVIQVQ